jgi:stringent starvation protein B
LFSGRVCSFLEIWFTNQCCIYFFTQVQGQTFEEALEAQRNKLKEKEKKKEKKKESPADKKKKPKKGKEAKDARPEGSVSTSCLASFYHGN